MNYLRTIQGKGTIKADTTHGRPGETGVLVPGASMMGPTRPVPYFHPAPAAKADTTRAAPAEAPKKPEGER